ncbi:hypothetical protein [Flavobacterium sp. 3HN19-14]|uniref:hypothetical protein n=1 Tax=Flavobacterium sp. 3HN19-14 TaxID=3448133 RepID=UPI003EE24A82
MNRNRNTMHKASAGNESKPYPNGISLCFSAAKAAMHFELFQYSTNYHEKLPIIYANIRV